MVWSSKGRCDGRGGIELVKTLGTLMMELWPWLLGLCSVSSEEVYIRSSEFVHLMNIQHSSED